MNEQCLFSCVWNMATCVTDKSLFRDPESICKVPCANAMRSFTWEVDGAPLVSVPSPYAPQCSMYHLSLILHGSPNPTEWERQIRQIPYEKKHHGRDTFEVWWQKWGQSWSRNRKLWKEQRNNLLEIVSTVSAGGDTSQNFSHRQLHRISCAFYRCCCMTVVTRWMMP